MTEVKIDGFAVAEEIEYEGTYIYDLDHITKSLAKKVAKDIANGDAYLVAYVKETPEAILELLGQEGFDEYNEMKGRLDTLRQRRSDSARRGWKTRRRKEDAEAVVKFAAFGDSQ